MSNNTATKVVMLTKRAVTMDNKFLSSRQVLQIPILASTTPKTPRKTKVTSRTSIIYFM